MPDGSGPRPAWHRPRDGRLNRSARDQSAREILRFALASLRKPKAPMVTEGSSPMRLEVVIQSREHRQEVRRRGHGVSAPGRAQITPFVEEELPFADSQLQSD